MATVSIRFSQNVVDQQRTLDLKGSPYGTLGGIVGNADPAYGVDLDVTPLNWSLNGSTLRVNYTKGVTETYTGVVRDNPLASSGHASATLYQLDQAGVLSVRIGGRLNFDYSLGNGSDASLETSAQGHILDSIRIATQYDATNPNYDAIFGNVAVGMGGRLFMAADGSLSGITNAITVQADKLLQGATAEGTFSLDPAGGVSGLLTGYRESYYDGGTLVIGGVAADVAAVGQLDSIYTDPRVFGGDDVIQIEMPGRLYAQQTVQAGAGADQITLKGGGGLLGVHGGDGNDIITLLDGSHTVDGGAGLDTVRIGDTRAAYAIQAAKTGTGFTLTDRNGGVSQLDNVERIMFSDTAYALDIHGNGGQAYRLYQAAFARTPDEGGLGFWIDKFDKGLGADAIAQGFIDSPEYKDKYGLVSTNRELVYTYYANILHRAPEEGGLTFWVDVLDNRKASVAEVLADISESQENQQNVAMLIGNGFAYTPYS